MDDELWNEFGRILAEAQKNIAECLEIVRKMQMELETDVSARQLVKAELKNMGIVTKEG